MSDREEDFNEIIRRRFGRDHEAPCNKPEILTCALWECQKAGYCQAGIRPALGTGVVISLRHPSPTAG